MRKEMLKERLGLVGSRKTESAGLNPNRQQIILLDEKGKSLGQKLNNTFKANFNLNDNSNGRF
jgi:hypothetical protein